MSVWFIVLAAAVVILLVESLIAAPDKFPWYDWYKRRRKK